jgi:2-C-methyl-D-erythritol 4-phosphate cytidylyltransferase
MDPEEYADTVPALGVVVEEGRGALPFALIHGEALVACAAWAMGDAGVTVVDLGTEWAGVVDAEEPFVLHDSLCPMTPAPFIAACLAQAVENDRVVVAVRPVTDTVKQVRDGVVGATVDRDTLFSVASPIVLPASVVAALDELPDLDFATLAAALAERFPVELVDAPPAARRVSSVQDVAVLQALTAGR